MDGIDLSAISPLLDPALPGGAGASPAGVHGRPEKQSLEQAAKNFESVLLYKLLEEVKRTIPESGLFGGAASGQIQEMFWYHLASALAEQGGIGLWKQLVEHVDLNDTPGDGPATTEQIR